MTFDLFNHFIIYLWKGIPPQYRGAAAPTFVGFMRWKTLILIVPAIRMLFVFCSLFMPSLCFGLHSDIKPSIGEPFSTMRDTVYPGTDLAILKMDPLKKEGFPGEGIAINMIIMNYGFSESASTKIDFWVSEEDEPDLDTNNINSTKLLAPLKMDTKVDFSHLVVIPADYTGRYVYITAVIRPNPKNGSDPTPGNNTMFTAVRIGSADSYKGGIYSYDGAMKEITMVNPIRKLKRGKPYPFQVKFSITGVRAPKAGQYIDILLSADPVLDDTDATIASFPAIPGVNGVVKDIKKDLVFGKQFRKGKAYIFAVIRPGKWKDPNMDNNYSKPLKIRLK